MRTFVSVPPLVLVASLGCGGLMGYGEEIAAHDVTPGDRFKVEYTPKTSEPHQLWVDTELSWQGSKGHVSGKLKVGKGELLDVDFDHDEAPMGGNRVTLSSFETGSSLSATIWVMKLPGSAAGEPVKLQGKWDGTDGTRIDKLRFIVTD